MKKLLPVILASFFLAACATPVTTMQKGNSVVTCGGGTAGSLTGGLVGYTIQEGHDQDCVKAYATQGYKIVTPHGD